MIRAAAWAAMLVLLAAANAGAPTRAVAPARLRGKVEPVSKVSSKHAGKVASVAGGLVAALSATPPTERPHPNATLPRIAIVPGITLCNVEKRAWYAWLRDNLQGPPLHLHVALQHMPNCWGAREHIWIPFMRNNLSIGADTVIVGHSSGAIAAMRFAQQYKVAGLVLVATYESTLGLGMERRSEYFDTPWDWAAIRRNSGFIIQFASPTDPWLGYHGRKGGWQEQMDVAKQLNSTLHIVPRGHYLVPTFPELLDSIISKLSGGSAAATAGGGGA